MTHADLPGEIFASSPVVYAAGDEYQIFIIPASRTVMWCRIGQNEYYDDSNGVLRSETMLHKISVPAAELDAAGEYTIGYRRFQKRVPYFNEADLEGEVTFKFRKVASETPKFFLLSDVHNRIESGISAAASFSGMDFLVINGDIHDNSESPERLLLSQQIAARVTGGEIPVVFSRGNHDLRGAWAEKQAEFSPTVNGRSYYTFRLGNIWGLVLDCGEDKKDESKEYGGVNCCHAFRQRETRFLEKVIADAAGEYNAPGVKYRLIISHIDFSAPQRAPFDIEYDIYSKWCELIRENIKPTAYFYGHVHKNYITLPGSERDIFDQGAPAVTAGLPERGEGKTGYIGAAVTLSSEKLHVDFVNQSGETVDSGEAPLEH